MNICLSLQCFQAYSKVQYKSEQSVMSEATDIWFLYNFRELEEDLDVAILYCIIFINAVNKQLNQLLNPKIKLSFSGIIVGTVRLWIKFWFKKFCMNRWISQGKHNLCYFRHQNLLQDYTTTLNIFKIRDLLEDTLLSNQALAYDVAYDGFCRYIYTETRLNKSSFDIAIALTT